MASFYTVHRLAEIRCPTLVCVGGLDVVTPVAAAVEIVEAGQPGIARGRPGRRHFPWKDAPVGLFATIGAFVSP